MAGRRCLYCGAALPEAIAGQPVTTSAASAALDRRILIIDVSAEAAALATALGRQFVEAEAIRRRGRPLLHRILPVAEAAAEQARLAALAVSALSLRESSVRDACRPRLASGGDPANGVFAVEPGAQTCRVSPSDVLLVLWGPIRREPLNVEMRSMRDLRRVSRSRASEGELFHVHTRSCARPMEIDPSAFALAKTGAAIESTPLRIWRSIESLACGTEIDRTFRQETPVLGVSEGGQPTRLARALEKESEGSRRKPATFLDNVSQFRFYSAWRGALARQLAGLPEADEPPL